MDPGPHRSTSPPQYQALRATLHGSLTLQLHSQALHTLSGLLVRPWWPREQRSLIRDMAAHIHIPPKFTCYPRQPIRELVVAMVNVAKHYPALQPTPHLHDVTQALEQRGFAWLCPPRAKVHHKARITQRKHTTRHTKLTQLFHTPIECPHFGHVHCRPILAKPKSLCNFHA